MSDRELHAVAARTRDVYERNAWRFDAERTRALIERKWLERFRALLPPGGGVADVGCGTGDPIARYFLDHGYRVTGVDFAAAMLRVARARHPDAVWVHADMRDMALGESYDGIIAWHSFFHLTPADQERALARFAAHLRAKGVMMLTVGPEAGEVLGRVGDDPVYHASLSRLGYERLLAEAGISLMDFVASDPECGGATVLLARKAASPS